MILEPPARIDYSRLAQTVFENRRLRGLRAVIIGAGALGNEVVKTLGMLGVQQMLIIDYDTVESSNLARSFFLRDAGAAGRNKALALAEAAAGFFPSVQVRAAGLEVADVGLAEIQQADILFSCVDSDLARFEIASMATKLNQPVCDAGLGASNYSLGRVSYFPGRDGACFGCCLTRQRRQELFALVDCAAQPCGEIVAGNAYPSTPTMSAIIGAMQVELGLRALLESESGAATTVELSLAPARKLHQFQINKSDACPFHSNPGILVRAPGPSSQTTVRDLLRTSEITRPSGDPTLVLDWPVCARAECRSCRHSWAPMKRLAVLRRRGECPSCGSREISETEIIQTVGESSAWADRTLEALGLPDNHLYTIRFAEP